MVVEDSILCPTTMLLVLAMSTGAVNSTTVTELLQETSARHDKTVQ